MTPPPFQHFLDEHSAMVLRFLHRQVGPDEADDCFQETFLAALDAYPRLRAESNHRAWLLTIAHRKAIDSHRSRSRRAIPVDAPHELPGAPTAPDPAAEPSDTALWALVRALPDKQRAALTLRFTCDLTHSEIAQIVGGSELAARRNVHEAITRLRKEYTR